MITLSYRILGGDFDSAGLATRKLKEQLSKIGVGAPVMRRAMIASYEAEMNVVIHARTGTLWARLDEEKLDLEVADEGPGIPDVRLALQEGWSTASSQARQMGFGAGLGLPNIRKNSDLFEIETRVGRGTRIRSTILLGTRNDGDASPPTVPAFLSLDHERCRACLRCIFACPTAALRVHGSRPAVLPELCVGCTACAAECADEVFGIDSADRGAALRGSGAALPPVPPDAVLVLPRGFLAGFPVDGSPPRVLAALQEAGFQDVRLVEEWEQALRREARARADSGSGPLPLIPPFCPAVVALVESRFPSLIPHLGPGLSPLEAAGEEFPLRPVFLVAACGAQYSAAGRTSLTDRLTVLTPARLAGALLPGLARRPAAAPTASASAGGEPAPDPRELAATGIRHVMRVLLEAEAGALDGATLLDLSLCDGGCAGSPLLCADPFLALHRWQRAPISAAHSDAAAVPRQKPYAQRHGVRLDRDMGEAIRRLGRIDELARTLPGRDCGACGAPSCAAFAEDVVMGRAEADGCPHLPEHREETQ
jgi:anti-sigma regulatory factor (Ser/Thr protein kinase)/NAD-dependent dihydropyrimidine dehydrogenase PreA subunit